MIREHDCVVLTEDLPDDTNKKDKAPPPSMEP